jgi:sirohydrochlorin cobaltochelatase
MLILIAHGSRDIRWRTSVEQVVASVQTDVGVDRVSLAYMDCTPPTLDDVVVGASARGIRRFRLLPLFLATEGHVERDILPLVDAVRTSHPSIEIEVLEPVGQHPLFRELLREITVQVD